jgi:hypothetical protein
MRLPIRNKGERPLTVFIEPLCDEYEVPVGGEAIIYLEDGLPHSIDVHEAWVTIFDEGADGNVEVISEKQQSIVEALGLARGWLYNLGARDVAAQIDNSIGSLEKSEGYLRAHAEVFEAFYKGFKIQDSQTSPNADQLPAWTGNGLLSGPYGAGAAAARLNFAQRSLAAFPGLGVGPFDTDTVRTAFDRAAAVVDELGRFETG